jgi:hypothetical protein
MAGKVGRPRKAQEQAKNPAFSVRLVPSEAQEIRQAIARSGKKKSEWIRFSLLHAARSVIGNT